MCTSTNTTSGARSRDHLDRGVDLRRLADHVDVVAELGADAAAEQVVVVDEEHPYPARRSWRAPTASTARPRCPRRAVSAPRRVPPWRCMRPVIDSAMPPRSVGTDAGSKPRPRSRTNTVDLVGFDLEVDRDHRCARVPRRVHHGLTRRQHQRLHVVVEGALAHRPAPVSIGTPSRCSTSAAAPSIASPRSRSACTGARPNSQARSSRSCRRASPTTHAGRRRGAGSSRGSAAPSRAGARPSRRARRSGCARLRSSTSACHRRQSHGPEDETRARRSRRRPPRVPDRRRRTRPAWRGTRRHRSRRARRR